MCRTRGRYKWENASAVGFYNTLTEAYNDKGRAQLILSMSGVKITDINFEQESSAYWKQAVEVAARADRIPVLFEKVRADESIAGYHSILDGWEDSIDDFIIDTKRRTERRRLLLVALAAIAIMILFGAYIRLLRGERAPEVEVSTRGVSISRVQMLDACKFFDDWEFRVDSMVPARSVDKLTVTFSDNKREEHDVELKCGELTYKGVANPKKAGATVLLATTKSSGSAP